MIRIGDFVSARLVERSQGLLKSGIGQKEGIYLKKHSNTVTIDLLDADALAKLHSGEIKEIKPDMLHECWLYGATLVQDQNLSKIIREQILALRSTLK